MGKKTAIITIAALLAACQGETVPPPTADEIETAENEISPEVQATTRLCRAVAGATPSGNESMRAAFVSTPEGREYGGGVIAYLVKQNGYTFLGTEMIGDTCYAYARAKGEEWGKPFHLKWRCPVKLLGTSPTDSSKMLVEVVDDTQCDLDAERGTAKRQDVHVEMLHI